MAVKIDTKTARLLDANLNRAREGLRVVEDTARFIWNDKKSYHALRTLRHELQAVTQSQYKRFLTARESRRDVGRRIKEKGRSQIKDVVAANMKRAQEATRVLEEYAKVFSRNAHADFKKIRYKLYTQEKQLLKRL